MAASSSSSSSSSQPTQAVWIYRTLTPSGVTPQAAFERVALVEAPLPLPAIISYLGNYYTWSLVHLCYLQTTPAAVTASGRTQVISVEAQPQF